MNSRNLIVWTMIILGAACFVQAITPKVAEEESIRIVLSRAPGSLDPQLDPTVFADIVFGNVYETLVTIDDDGAPEPRLAVKWHLVGDRAWRFVLRQGVVFHDGRPFTSEDVVASIERGRHHPESTLTMLFQTVDEVTAEDEHTVLITLTTPDALFLKKMASSAVVPANSPDLITHMVGTGPYEMVEHDPGRSITLRAFADSWRPRRGVASARFLFEGDQEAALQRLADGEVDMVTNLASKYVGRVESSQDLWVESAIGGTIHILGLSANVSPGDDPLVREAIDYAIDREAIAREIFGNFCRPAGQLVNSFSTGYVSHLQPTKRNLTRARALIAATGKEEIHLRLEDENVNGALLQELKRQLAEAGIHLDLVELPWEELFPRILSGKSPSAAFTWRADGKDLGFILDVMVHSASPSHADLGYSGPVIDRLAEAARSNLDPAQRLELLHAAAERILAKRVVLPLVWGMDLFAVRRDVGWAATPGGFVDLRDISMNSGTAPSSGEGQ